MPPNPWATTTRSRRATAPERPHPRRDRQAERNQQVESEGPPVRHGFRIAEFCRRNSVGRSFAYDQIAAGRLKAVKAGRITLITAEAERDWLEALPAFQPAST